MNAIPRSYLPDPREVYAAGHQLAEILNMLSKGELQVVLHSLDNLESIAEHSFSVNDDVGMSGRFCAVQTEEGHLAVGSVEGQPFLSRPLYLLFVEKTQ